MDKKVLEQEERDMLLGKSEPVTMFKKNNRLRKLLRLPEREYQIEKKPLPYGVTLQICDCLAMLEGIDKLDSLQDMAKFVIKNDKYIVKIIGYAFNCNSDINPPNKLLKLIRSDMDNVKIVEVFYFIIEQTYLANFTTAISLTMKKLVAKEESEVKPK